MTKRTALVILNSSFSSPILGKLPQPRVDSERLVELLGATDTGAFSVTALIDPDVQTFRELIVRKLGEQDSQDVFLLHYAGLALQDRYGEIYLAAKDTDPEVLDATGLRLRLIRDQLDRTQGSQNMVLLDCPTIAAFHGGRDVVGSTSGILEALEGNRQGRLIVASSDIITGALEGQEVAGSPEASELSALLQTGIAGGHADLNSDGQIRSDELYEYAYRESLTRAPNSPLPRKFVSADLGSVVLARNPVLQPADLPNELIEALKSPSAWMREGAVPELERLLSSNDKSISFAAHEALTELAADPTPEVSRSATAILQSQPPSRTVKAGLPVDQTPPSATTQPERRLAIPTWGWIIAGVIGVFALGLAIPFAIGVVGGISGLLGTSPVTETPELPAQATSTPLPVAAATEEPAPVATSPTSVESIPSSLGMVSISGGTYPIAGDRAIGVGNYWIDRFEVTNNDFAQFLAGSGQPMPRYWIEENIPAAMGDHPVRAVTWDMAQAYCDGLGKRLPTEAEWEVSARGPEGLLYPWGNEAETLELPTSGTYAVGSIPANRSIFGIFDMAGNVWEWVSEPYLPVEGGLQVLRGGANNFPNDMTYRLIGEPDSSATIVDAGFRCATDKVELQTDQSLLLTDEFADVLSGWYQAAEPIEEYFYGYHPSDFYHVQVSSPENCLAVRYDAPFDDIIVDLDVFRAKSETEDGDYRQGLVIRERDGEFYAFLISPRTQTWQVVRNRTNGVTILDQGIEASIRGEAQDQRDRLTVTANGPQFDLAINGSLVSSVFDDTYRDGNLGFIVQTLDETYAHIHFDRIFVWDLPDSAIVPEMPLAARPSQRIDGPACDGAVTGDDLLQNFFTYTVKEGDTLSGIANSFGLSLDEVKGANGRRITDPNAIVVGQVLVIPDR